MLELGPKFDRSYSIRIPFLETYYKVSVFFNKRNAFCLFNVAESRPKFEKMTDEQKQQINNVKISMYKNLQSSLFCEVFLQLHSYRKSTLDIINQFNQIRNEYQSDISFIFNESLTLSRLEIHDRKLNDVLTIYGFTMTSYSQEYAFIIAERQYISKRFEKKIVRSTGCQIATTYTLDLLDEYVENDKQRKLIYKKQTEQCLTSPGGE